MKLLDRYAEPMDAEAIAFDLEQQGILAYVSSANAYLFGKIQTGSLKTGLWIVLDHQFDDAKAYLLDKNHEITSALSAEEIEQLKLQTVGASNSFFKQFLIGSGIIFLVVAVSIWFASRDYLASL